MSRQFKKWGDCYSIQSSLSPYPFIFTENPRLIDQILRLHHRKYDKSIYQTEILRKYVGRGLLTNYGIDWKRQRKLIQPGFSHKRIEALYPIMWEEIVQLVEEIPSGQKLDFYMVFNRLAFRVVARALFSSHISEKDIERILEIISTSQKYFILESRNPLFSSYLKYSGKLKKHLDHEVQEVRSIFRNISRERRASGETHDDLLDLLLSVTYEDTGETMEEEQLIDELLILFIAGHETTANVLSFSFWLLGKHSEYQHQIKKEASLPKKNQVKALFEDSIIQRVLLESMRLYPPVWVLDRQSLEPDSFEEFSWPEDTIIVGNVFNMNRRKEIWDQPYSFDPSRFEDTKALKKKVFVPFGSGPRYCIGEHFAKMEMQMVLRYFFRNFRFETFTNQPKLLTYVTLRPDKIMGSKIAL